MMSPLQAKVPTDTWVNATWEEYLEAIADPVFEKAKGYYYNGCMRLEITSSSNPQSRDRATIMSAIYLFAGLKGIDLDAHDNCTYRKMGCEEAQPDISFYVGANAEAIPWEATIIDLNTYPPPDLAIEVSFTSLADDKGEKRLLYESIGVREYWIVDVKNVQLIAFEVRDLGSRRIRRSQIISGLDLSILEEALRRSRNENHGKVSAWLLNKFQNL